jgi:hypothetical protein
MRGLVWLRLLAAIMWVILGVGAFAAHGPSWVNFLLGLGFGLGCAVQFLLWNGTLEALDDDTSGS